MGLSCSSPKEPERERTGQMKRRFKFCKWRKRKNKTEVALNPFELLPLEMYNEILIKLEAEDRLVCRLLSSKFCYFVDSLFKFSLTLTDENVSDFCTGNRFLRPDTLRIGDLFHKTLPSDFPYNFPTVSSLHFISRTSRINAQTLLCKHTSVQELHLHSPFLAGAKNIIRDADEELTVFETLVHLHLTMEFVPPTLGQDLRVSILQNNLDDVLRYTFPELETIHVKIVAGELGEQFYFSFKRLCVLLERHSERLSTVYLEAPALKPINVSSDMELPIIYSLLSRCHPKITFHIKIGDSEQQTFAAHNYRHRGDFLGDLTEAAVKRQDKKLLGTLFHAFTDAESILTYNF